jgi:peroxiredoxin
LVAIIAGKPAVAFEPEVGKPLPGFTLPRIGSGDPVSLSDYHGQKVLLIMFASW